jgi:ribulose bisphosphate carboxylase small subunit
MTTYSRLSMIDLDRAKQGLVTIEHVADTQYRFYDSWEGSRNRTLDRHLDAEAIAALNAYLAHQHDDAL